MSCKYIITRHYNYSTAVFLSFFYKTLIKMLSIIIIIIIIIIIPIPNTVNLHVQRIS